MGCARAQWREGETDNGNGQRGRNLGVAALAPSDSIGCADGWSLTSFATGNAGLWNDKKTDDLYEQKATSLENNKRKQLLQEIQRYLLQDDKLPVAPTVRNFDWYSVKSKIRGWPAPAYYLSQFSWQYDKVWLDQ